MRARVVVQQRMRALCVMASPITAAVATRWINDGTADTILRFIRAETMERESGSPRAPWSQDRPLGSANITVAYFSEL